MVVVSCTITAGTQEQDFSTNSNHRRTKKILLPCPFSPPCPLVNKHSKVWHLRFFSDSTIFSCYGCISSSRTETNNHVTTSQERMVGYWTWRKEPGLSWRVSLSLSFPTRKCGQRGSAVPRWGGGGGDAFTIGEHFGTSSRSHCLEWEGELPTTIPSPWISDRGGHIWQHTDGEGRSRERALLLPLSPPMLAHLTRSVGPKQCSHKPAFVGSEVNSTWAGETSTPSPSDSANRQACC